MAIDYAAELKRLAMLRIEYQRAVGADLAAKFALKHSETYIAAKRAGEAKKKAKELLEAAEDDLANRLQPELPMAGEAPEKADWAHLVQAAVEHAI
ncbi:MAG: hypothetical protein ABFE07_05785 [Armatimonadia bacterium]